MVKQTAPDSLFSALSNGTRRAILEDLRAGPRSISELADPFEMSLVAVSKHVHVLEDAGLVRIRRRGRSRICRLDAAPLLDGVRWLAGFASFWQDELDQIERYLEARALEGGADDDADDDADDAEDD